MTTAPPTCEMCDAPTTKVCALSLRGVTRPLLRVALCDDCWDELDPPRHIRIDRTAAARAVAALAVAADIADDADLFADRVADADWLRDALVAADQFADRVAAALFAARRATSKATRETD